MTKCDMCQNLVKEEMTLEDLQGLTVAFTVTSGSKNSRQLVPPSSPHQANAGARAGLAQLMETSSLIATEATEESGDFTIEEEPLEKESEGAVGWTTRSMPSPD